MKTLTWEATFNDTKVITQFDTKGRVKKEILFSDVEKKKLKNLTEFKLIDSDGHTFSVNLVTGKFYVDSEEYEGNADDHYTLYYARRRIARTSRTSHMLGYNKGEDSEKILCITPATGSQKSEEIKFL